MTFAYYEYLFNNLLLPVLALAFVAVPVVRMLIRIVRQLARGEGFPLNNLRDLILFVLLLIVGGLLVNVLFHGGLHLVYERPSDAVTIQGTIQEIDACSAFSGARYSSNNEMSFGYEYTIDGETCVGMAKGTLAPGDQVSVTYLPNSGFILSIEEITP